MQSLSGETGVYSQVCLTPRLLFPPRLIPCEPLSAFEPLKQCQLKDITTNCFQELLQSEFHKYPVSSTTTKGRSLLLSPPTGQILHLQLTS